MRKLRLPLLLAVVLTASMMFADTVILDNVTGNPGTAVNETRTPNFGILAQIVVGGSNVTIDRFGVFGNLNTAGNVAWAIFQPNGTRVYNSGLVAEAAGSGNSWNDSPTFNLTLVAGTTYYFGIISDQQFTYHWFDPGATTISGGGLTSPGGNSAGSNGNFSNAADPTLVNTSFFVQQGTRVFANDTPEPGSLFLLGSGLIGLGGAVRRRLVR